MMDKHVVILGAGPAGLTAAYELSQHSVASTVLEADNIVGGIARTEQYKGYHYDIGGHRFYTKMSEVNRIWHEVMGDDFIVVPCVPAELYARVRSFVFVSDLGEVTHLFRKTDIATAVDLATASRVINLAANSNYGRALELFRSTWLGTITRRTTVIVIGDGRTNYNPPQAWVLGEIRRKCRRLVWLCPEERQAWGFGDSEMPLYARHCDRVESVRSLDDLARVAAELMP